LYEHRRRSIVDGSAQQNFILDSISQTVVRRDVTSTVIAPALESDSYVQSYLTESQMLAEIIATGLVQALSGEKFSTLMMDWLPPHLIKDMDMRDSSTVESRIDTAALVESGVKHEYGLEKLAGLPKSTQFELIRISTELKDRK